MIQVMLIEQHIYGSRAQIEKFLKAFQINTHGLKLENFYPTEFQAAFLFSQLKLKIQCLWSKNGNYKITDCQVIPEYEFYN